MKYLNVLLAGQAVVQSATTLPKVVASNYPYRPDMSHIMYNNDVKWTTSLTEYSGFQMQTWGFCHSAPWVTNTNISMQKLCEAERLGNLNPVDKLAGGTNYCSGSFKGWNGATGNNQDGSNDVEPGAAGFVRDKYADRSDGDGEKGWCKNGDSNVEAGDTGDNSCQNPSCWVSACDYDSVDCTSTTVPTDTGTRWGVIQDFSYFYGTQDMCSWDNTYVSSEHAFKKTNNDEYLAHTQVNDLMRISEPYFYEFQIVDESSTTGGSATQAYKRSGIQQMSTATFKGRRTVMEEAYTTLLDSTGLKVAYKLEAYRAATQTGFFDNCEEGDTISAFTVTRLNTGKFSYSAPVKIGTFSKLDKPEQIMPTSFYFDGDSDASSSSTFLMRQDNKQSKLDTYQESTLLDATMNFACVRSDRLVYKNCDMNSNLSNKCIADGTSCKCDGIKAVMDGNHAIWTASCSADTAGKWDGYSKCTVTGGAKLNTLCNPGDALVNLDSRSNGDLSSAVVGYFNSEPLQIKSTEFLYLVNENDIAFPNPAFNHPSTNISKMTLLVGCSASSSAGTSVSAPAKYWTVRDDSHPAFDADAASAQLLTSQDRAFVDGTYTMFNSIHNELNTFHNDCKKGNYVVGSVDGVTWNKIARIGAAVNTDYQDAKLIDGVTSAINAAGDSKKKAAAVAGALGAAAVGLVF